MDKYEEALRKGRITVDPKTLDLAIYFMSDVEDHTPADVVDLAMELQEVCQDVCRDVEQRIIEELP